MKMFNALSRITLLTFIFGVLAFTACKDNDDPDPVEPDTNPIVGSWQLTAITPEVAGTNIPALVFLNTVAPPCLYDLKLTFNSNNKITTSDCDAAVSLIDPFVPVGTDANWEVDGDKLILSKGNTSEEFRIIQTATDLTVVVNTETNTAKPAANVLLLFKRV